MTLRKRHFKTVRILAFALVLSAGARVHGTDALPKPTRLVTDTAAVLLPGEVDQLEARLQRLRDSGLAEAIVYIVPSLPEGALMDDVVLRAVSAWGIGDAATNNGLAIFVFIKDRKVRIAVGRGLEARISDAAAAAIIEERMVPSFRARKYSEGLTAAIDRIEALVRPTTPALVSRQDSPAATSEPASSDGTLQYVKTRLGKTRRIVGVMEAPRPVRRVNPHFPEDARRARIQGLVLMEVLIDTSGKVNKVTVTQGLSHGLSEAAVEAVEQWIFQPVTVGDAAVPVLIDVVVNFRL